MKIHLVAIDLDGTLLNSSKQISGQTALALRLAREQAGARVVIASARPPRSVRPFYEQLGLDEPTINYNGALVYDPPSRRILLHSAIPARTAIDLTAVARRACPEVLISGEVLDRWYTDRFDPEYATETARLFRPDVIAPLHDWLVQPITKLLFLGPPDRVTDVARAFHREHPHQVVMVRTEQDVLQVMHATVSKAQALRVVAAELGVRRDQVMAIGDNANDVGMLRWAGLGVAVANAVPAAAAAADAITAGHDDDGVAKAVQRFVLTPPMAR